MHKKDFENIAKLYIEGYSDSEDVLNKVVELFQKYGDIEINEYDEIEGFINNFLRHDWSISNLSGEFSIDQYIPTDEMDTDVNQIIQKSLKEMTPEEFLNFVRSKKVDI